MNTNECNVRESRSFIRLLTVIVSVLGLFACEAANPPRLSKGHLSANFGSSKGIPKPVMRVPRVPLPAPKPRQETYTVVVSDVPVKELLFSLARDAKLNIDINPDITGKVSINAVKQTLPKILERIARQVSLRYQLKGKTLVIGPDSPYWQNYRIDYVNMSRKSVSEVSVATRIATTGGSVNKQNEKQDESGNGNVSKTKVTNSTNNDFWKTLVKNLEKIIYRSKGKDKSRDMSASVITNPTSGVISIKATQAQHREVQSFLDQVMTNSQRQVLIEMTIVEVELSDHYQSGIDWQRLSSNNGQGSNGLSLIGSLLGSNLATPPVFSLGYNRTTANGTNFSATLKMLETFGNVRVISSPKLMALNNQTALLKVVDEKVYFTVKLEVQEATTNTPERRTFTSQIHTVPVGLVMSVVPQINKDGYVSLNIRPTITRITGFAQDPAPSLMNEKFTNLIPEIQVREMESLLQVANGQTIIMGGLMQNKINKNTNEIPALRRWKKLKNLLSYKNHKFTKTELVIFIKPTIIKAGGTRNRFFRYRKYLPGSRGSIFNAKKTP